MSSQDSRAIAEARFAEKQKKQGAIERPMSGYQTAARTVDLNTARLRALRLEKEAAEREQMPAAAKASGKRRRARHPVQQR